MPAPTNRRAAKYRRPWLAPYQLAAIFGAERYALIEATTKAGKTAGCLVWLFEQAAAGRAGRSYWWIAPVYSQAEIAYRRMKRAIPRSFYRSNDTERRLELVNGALIWFKSGEKPDNLYGEDVFAAVIDEASRVDEESWHAVRSTLTATRGPLRIIGNVKGRKNWFYKLARKAERGQSPDSRYAKITWKDAVASGILRREEIDQAMADLPESVFRELYEAEPSELSGRVYRDFGAANLSTDVRDLGGDLLVGMDFNVNPMSAVLCSRAGDELHAWGEIVLSNSNTQEMAHELRGRFGARSVRVYPDPSGNHRKTSAMAGETDFSILRSFGFAVVASASAPPVVDRINEVNALACNASGRRRLFVNQTGCPHLVEALEDLTYKPGTSQPDKDTGLDHITDALGYLVHQEFPIVGRSAGFASTLEFVGV